MKKFHVFIGIYICFLFIAYLAYWQSAYSIKHFSVQFEHKNELEVSLCNPTNNDMTFYDGLGFGQNNSFLDNYVFHITYKTSDGDVVTLKKAQPGTPGMPSANIRKGNITAGECLRKKDNIKNYLGRLETKLNKTARMRSMEEIDIIAFRVRVVVYKYYSSYIKVGTKSFESPWFELENSATQSSEADF